MRTKSTSSFKQRLEALRVSRIVVLSVMDQIGVKRFREEDLKEVIRTAADEIVNTTVRDRAR